MKVFCERVATGGSVLGVGQWCRFDHDEKLGPVQGMFGKLDAELEVERTIKSAELTFLVCLLCKAFGPNTDHVDNRGIMMGFGEEK